jgi:hypothetical protein
MFRVRSPVMGELQRAWTTDTLRDQSGVEIVSFQSEIQALILRSRPRSDHVIDRDSVRSRAWRRGFARGFLDVLAAPVTLLYTDRTRKRRVRDIILREIRACDTENVRDVASGNAGNREPIAQRSAV